MALERSGSRTPSCSLTAAAACLIEASAQIIRRSSRRPEIGKLSTARWVWAPQYASSGTATSPMESFSMRVMPGTLRRLPTSGEEPGEEVAQPGGGGSEVEL